MKTEQSIFYEASGWVKKSDNSQAKKAQLVFLFGNKSLLMEQQHIDFVRGIYENAQIIGCSTSGEISQENIYNNNIAY